MHTPARGAAKRGARTFGYCPAVWDAKEHDIARGGSSRVPRARRSSSCSVGIARVVGDAYGYHGWVARRVQATNLFVFLVVLQVFSERSEAGSYSWYQSDSEKQDETCVGVNV